MKDNNRSACLPLLNGLLDACPSPVPRTAVLAGARSMHFPQRLPYQVRLTITERMQVPQHRAEGQQAPSVRLV